MGCFSCFFFDRDGKRYYERKYHGLKPITINGKSNEGTLTYIWAVDSSNLGTSRAVSTLDSSRTLTVIRSRWN